MFSADQRSSWCRTRGVIEDMKIIDVHTLLEAKLLSAVIKYRIIRISELEDI